MIVTPPAAARDIYRIMREHRTNPLVSNMILTRGLEHALTPPLTLAPIPNLNEAAERIKTAIQHQQRITIFGDYDADGVTSTSILALGLSELTANVRYIIPERLTDGYGLTPAFTDDITETTDLLITVDTGITAVDTVKILQNNHVNVIITDHHSIQETLPDCLIVHPALHQEDLGLTGAGVAWHLLWATRIACGITDAPTWLTDYAAIGTIADVAPQTPWNRALIRVGLDTLNHTEHPGLELLTREHRGRIGTNFIGFQIAPLLNAAGRLNQAATAAAFLIDQNPTTANETLTTLKELNETRKLLTETVTREALTIAQHSNDPIIIIENPAWHAGVIGIAAARILETTGKSAFLSSNGKGSVRAAPGHHALHALQHTQTHLTAFGGHEKAAGYTLTNPHDTTAFQQTLHAYATQNPSRPPTITIDAVIHPDLIDALDTEQLHTLEPHGPNNPTPSFALIGTIKEIRGFGKNNTHTRIRMFTEGTIHGGVLWNKPPENLGRIGDPITLIGEITRNEWNNRTTIELSGRQTHTTTHPTPTTHTSIHRHKHDATTIIHELPTNPREAATTLKRITQTHTRNHQRNPNTTLAINLTEQNLTTLENHTRQLPRAHDIQRHTQTPNPPENPTIQRILTEINHQPITPETLYGSETYTNIALTRHIILNFITAYRHLDDQTFETHLRHTFPNHP